MTYVHPIGAEPLGFKILIISKSRCFHLIFIKLVLYLIRYIVSEPCGSHRSGMTLLQNIISSVIVLVLGHTLLLQLVQIPA